MNSYFDIIVVGCGVAGATAAETVASLGSSALVLEEHRQAGVPSHCAGHVGINSMRRFGPRLPHEVVRNEIRGAIFHSPSGQVIRLERSSPITWVIDRKTFDEHLATRAEKAGAQIHFNSRAVRMEPLDTHRIQVKASTGDERRVFNCSLVIDCEGVSPSLISGRLRAGRRRPMWVNSAQVHLGRVKDLDERMVEVYFGSTYSPGFFAWIIPWRDGSAKVGLAARQGNPRTLLQKFMTKHPEVSRRLKDTERHDMSFHPIPLSGPISRTFYPGLLVSGDSAQQVKPTTGGGIIFSLICGRTAGEVAHEAVAYGDTSESFLSEYERRWKNKIGFDLNMMRRVRRMLFRIPDRQLEKIFSAGRALDVAGVLNRADDIDMQGRALTRLGLDPRLAVSLLYSAVLSLPFLADSGGSSTAHGILRSNNSTMRIGE